MRLIFFSLMFLLSGCEGVKDYHGYSCYQLEDLYYHTQSQIEYFSSDQLNKKILNYKNGDEHSHEIAIYNQQLEDIRKIATRKGCHFLRVCGTQRTGDK